jgi:excisionase family DNA binding protein
MAYITTGEAARRLQLSPERVRQLVDSGKLRAKRGLYGHRLVDAEVVEIFAQQRRERGRERATAAAHLSGDGLER